MSNETLKIIPLGGLGEIGKNMTVIEYGNDIIVIDAGLMFPEEQLLGVDLVLPDYSYLRENRDRVRAIILTHGHEDHVGCLPFLLREINIPLYGTRLTIGLAKGKLAEYLPLDELELSEIDPRSDLEIGPFRLEFMRVCHSIPDGVGLAIHTPVGVIVHSGDFKFDQTPVDGITTDFSKFAVVGDRGVLALLSDSTNSEDEGFTRTERSVGTVLNQIVGQARRRVIAASFASHIHRIQQIMEVAHGNGRRVAITGLSMIRNISIASELGYLQIPEKLLVPVEKIDDYPEDQILILSTGSQGEPLSALARIASHDHKKVDLRRGDTVIISATPVPGNEKSVSKTIDQLFKSGAEVYYESIAGVHVSGHGAREELKLMINLVRPKYFIPIHGEYRHLIHHAMLAADTGMEKDKILLAGNGDVIEFSQDKGAIVGRIESGVIFVDGLGVGDVGDVVIRDRQRLSQHGMIIVVATVDGTTGKLLAGPDIISRGFVGIPDSAQILEEAKRRVEEALLICEREAITDWMLLKSHVKDSLSRFLFTKTMKRPMIIPVIMEV